MPRLAEAARGRADEDERAVAAPCEPAEEGARGEERRGQVGGDRLLEAREVELPDGQVLRGIDTRHGRADVDRPERVPCLGEEALGVGLDGQVGLCDRRAAELLGERPRALLAAVVVDEDARALGGERPRARRADAARRARHHDALPCEPRLHGASLCR